MPFPSCLLICKTCALTTLSELLNISAALRVYGDDGAPNFRALCGLLYGTCTVKTDRRVYVNPKTPQAHKSILHSSAPETGCLAQGRKEPLRPATD